MQKILTRLNEWWSSGEIPTELVPKTRRLVFSELKKLIDGHRITNITGLRRTGKTTLMFQLMDMLIRQRGVDPKNILFIPCDDLELRGMDDLIGKAVTTYFEDILKRDYRKETAYIFIDEIHWVEDWQFRLKGYHDLAYKMKFIISGSSAVKIRRKQKESLVGRIEDVIIFPLSFAEFLSFKEGSIDRAFPGIPLPEITYENIEEWYWKGPRQRVLDIRAILDEYMLVGGLPEWFKSGNLREWQTRIRDDVIRRVVYDDIAQLFNVRSGTKIEDILKLLSAFQSRTYSYNSIADTVGLDNITATRYVDYLRESHLLFELRNYSSTRDRQIRKNYRYIVVDTGIRNSLEFNRELSQDDIGYLVEGVVQQHVLWHAARELWEVFFWLDKVEVDIVVKIGRTLIPIEVKYQNEPSMGDLKGLFRFMERYKVKKGFVITKDKLSKEKRDGKEILFIPLWLFLCVQ